MLKHWQIYLYIYYRVNNVNDKMIKAFNDHGQSCCFKQTLLNPLNFKLVVYKFDRICKDIQRKFVSLFPI